MSSAAPQPRRVRTTRPSVRVIERVMRTLITVGGMGTIASVVLMFVFLVSVALPLFRNARAEEPRVRALDAGQEPEDILADERGTLLAAFHGDGSLLVRRVDDGTLLESLRPFGDAAPTARSIAAGNQTRALAAGELVLGSASSLLGEGEVELTGRSVAFGFADGSVRLGLAGFVTVFLVPERVPAELRELPPGERSLLAGGVLERTSEGAFRWQGFALHVDEPVSSSHAAAVRLLAHASDAQQGTFVAWREDGSLGFARVEWKLDWMTDEVEQEVFEAELPIADVAERGRPGWLLLAGAGDNAYAIWEDGWLTRWDVSEPESAAVVETTDLVSEPEARVSAARMLLGQTTLMIGDSLGRVRGWFRIKPEVAGTTDGSELALAHDLPSAASPVTALATATRSRVIASGHADGRVRLYYMATDRLLGEMHAPAGPVRQLEIVPKEDGLVAVADGKLVSWELDLGHPKAGWTAFFRPIWYEGYVAPGHTWQAEGSTDDFEPKFGFLPLVFGTLKATVYSMLFGLPLALLAALYTSEFLDRKLRTPIKSIIEMMASLPSVVLGFLAGVIITPFAASVLPASLAIFFTLPLALLVGAYLWQLLPARRVLRWHGWQRLFCISLALPVAIAAAGALGPLAERALFAGNLVLWLDGQVGSAFGGWFVVLFPLSALAVFVLFGRILNPRIRARSVAWERRRTALVDLSKFAAGLAATTLLALVGAWLFDLASLDTRGAVVGTYDSRNALVVGFVMGFAIIPIIYTLAEDALAGVPQHLRQASLSAGATTWQTAVRVVIPTAMSGLFSAMMIGLGRAVGETMIVLMAVGNTPIMEWNAFNGFRTLSANIATELPEAAQNSTHYRTLFFAALVLFAMTFVLNTLAEIVRLRYRRRAVQL